MTPSESSPRTKPGDTEEPEITQEESVPSDGPDASTITRSSPSVSNRSPSAL